ncbi:MAG: Uma2 family endonuclease [Isosphaeraceae bacterium]
MSSVAPTQPALPPIAAGAPTPPIPVSELYRLTVDQYERMGELGILTEDDRVELIDGYLMIKMGKNPSHVWSVDSIEQLFRALLGTAWCVRRESPVRIPDLNEPEPDLVVARGTRPTYRTRHPEPRDIGLIAEVSDTTYDRDRGKKWDANAKGGIPVYWIINLAKRRIEVDTDPGPAGYGSRQDYHAGEVVPVIIDGRQLGQILVDDILP